MIAFLPKEDMQRLAFLTGLQLVSTIFIVAANLIVGQLIECTKTLAGKARPWWVLLSALTLSVASVLMLIIAARKKQLDKMAALIL